MGSLGSSWLPTQILMLQIRLLLALPLPGCQTVTNPSSSCTLNRTLGESVQLQLISSSCPNIREIEWNWDTEGGKKQFLVSWKPNAPYPHWYDLEDKYKHRFDLTKMVFLNIRNLTKEMNGLYAATIKFHSGESQEEAFRLCVYARNGNLLKLEPIPYPQILSHSSSNTSGWCNASLECRIPGSPENLTVTWLSKVLSRELQQRGTLAPSNSKNLSLSLPLSQLNGQLTCVVSNPADQKNATVDLQSICLWRGSLQSKWLWTGILALVVMVILGTGVWIWKKKKMKTQGGGPVLLPVVLGLEAAPQALRTEGSAGLQTGGVDSHDPPYAEISLLRHPKNDTEKGSCHTESPKLTMAVHTVYEKIHTSPELEDDV